MYEIVLPESYLPCQTDKDFSEHAGEYAFITRHGRLMLGEEWLDAYYSRLRVFFLQVMGQEDNPELAAKYDDSNFRTAFADALFSISCFGRIEDDWYDPDTVISWAIDSCTAEHAEGPASLTASDWVKDMKRSLWSLFAKAVSLLELDKESAHELYFGFSRYDFLYATFDIKVIEVSLASPPCPFNVNIVLKDGTILFARIDKDRFWRLINGKEFNFYGLMDKNGLRLGEMTKLNREQVEHFEIETSGEFEATKKRLGLASEAWLDAITMETESNLYDSYDEQEALMWFEIIKPKEE